MSELNIELCPETGICSILKTDGTKVDLMPDEVAEVKAAAGDASGVKSAVSEADDNFAAALSDDEISQIATRLK